MEEKKENYFQTIKALNEKLSKKATLIKGHKYVEVSQRLMGFLETFPKGDYDVDVNVSENGGIVAKAVVRPYGIDGKTYHGTSYGNVSKGNNNGGLEDTETSALGRAFGMAGIGVIDTISSADEMRRAGYDNDNYSNPKTEKPSKSSSNSFKKMTASQRSTIEKNVKALKGMDLDEYFNVEGINEKELSSVAASALITKLIKESNGR